MTDVFKLQKKFKKICKKLDQRYLYMSYDDVTDAIIDFCVNHNINIKYEKITIDDDKINMQIIINNDLFVLPFIKFLNHYFCNREDFDSIIKLDNGTVYVNNS